jgi:hypothetical protein
MIPVIMNRIGQIRAMILGPVGIYAFMIFEYIKYK